MKKEAQQLLRDITVLPTNEQICECLGSVGITYNFFLKVLKEHDIRLSEWRYYNDGKAWLAKGEYTWITKRGTRKVKPIFWISIWEGFFKVSFNFSEKNRDSLLRLPLSQDRLNLIAAVKANGKTNKFLAVLFDVVCEKQLKDILVLAQFRKTSL